ncbi:MAG: phosphatidylglycerol lysyltransferase domain-containing protein [Eubacteriales bacterium]|nr:phosphatidylglycerol lysyltransferase domain-containing protein [Eubacteriales bacterium]
MIEFKRLKLSQKEDYEKNLFACPGRSCEYAFANMYLWGRQETAFFSDCVGFFSHFHGKSIYPYPVGTGDRRAVLEAVIEDARERGIPCRITSMTKAESEELESWFPGKFCFRTDRDGFDYVYAINDLADLRGRKFQKKRNHVHRFWAEHPEAVCVPLGPDNLEQAREMVEDWYRQRLAEDPHGEYLLEQVAMKRAFQHFKALGMEGLMLVEDGQVLAMTMGSRLSRDTIDVHFEKAREDADGAYAAINCEFARYLREKYPEVKFLNREDDMGLEGLRKAKLSYQPHHLEEKYWACLLENLNGDTCAEDALD